MDCIAYQWGWYGCSSPSTKVLHELINREISQLGREVSSQPRVQLLDRTNTF